MRMFISKNKKEVNVSNVLGKALDIKVHIINRIKVPNT